MLSKVVGFVLAAILLNVRGSERYDEEERDGEGEGGALGGMGRTDASSSASKALAGDESDSRLIEESSNETSSFAYDGLLKSRPSSSPLREMDLVLRRVGGLMLCVGWEGRGDDVTLPICRLEELRPTPRSSGTFSILFPFPDPANFR